MDGSTREMALHNGRGLGFGLMFGTVTLH